MKQELESLVQGALSLIGERNTRERKDAEENESKLQQAQNYEVSRRKEKEAIFRQINSWGAEFVQTALFNDVNNFLMHNRVKIYWGEKGHDLTERGGSSTVYLTAEGLFEYEATCRWGVYARLPLDFSRLDEIRGDYLRDVWECIDSGRVYGIIQSEIERRIKMIEIS